MCVLPSTWKALYWWKQFKLPPEGCVRVSDSEADEVQLLNLNYVFLFLSVAHMHIVAS